MTTPAGWYPDDNVGALRYWDGERWTEHTAPMPSAQPTPGAPPVTPAQPSAVTPLATDEASTSTTTISRAPGRLVGAGAAAVLVVIAGIFAVTQLASADGGAESPEAAVTSLLESLSQEDLVGMGEILLPGERRTYVDPALEGLDHLGRWGVLDSSLDTSDVGGFDFQVEGLEVRTESVSDDIVNVFASGSIIASIDGETLPIGDLLEDRAMEGEDRASLDAPQETETFSEVMITTVREDGRWYVSGLFTAAETMRRESSHLVPESGVEPIGADSPGAAVDGMVQALASLDLEAMVARLNPDEAQALQRYAPIFLSDAQAEMDAAVAEAGFSIEITDLDYDVHERDGIAVVTFNGARLAATGDGEELVVEVDGDCARVTVDGTTEEQCGSGDIPLDLSDAPFGDLEEIFSDMDEIGLVVAERDGEWYVSPIRSYTETVLAVMRAIERDDLERFLDSVEDGSLEQWFEDEFGSLVEQSFGISGIDTGGSELEEAFETIGEPVPDDPELADLRAACEQGDMAACDDLYWMSPIDSEDEEFGATCGGTTQWEPGGCQDGPDDSPAGDSYGSDATLDALWDACDGGDAEACDDLWWDSPIGSEYEAFGRTCGDRFPDATAGSCTTLMDEG